MFSGTGTEVCAQARAEGLDVLEPTMDTLVRHLQDACADFDSASHPSTPHDKHGWMDPYIMRVFNKLHASAPLLIVEVGSWKGQSAIAFAKHLQTLGPAHRLLCVDVRRSQPIDRHRALAVPNARVRRAADDTNMIMKYLGVDDYIIAAIELYLDIVNLFLFLLMLLSGGRR